MNEETMENLDSETQDGEGEIVETESEQDEETTESSQEDLVAQERKKFEDQRKRAEKAEAELKKLQAERKSQEKTEESSEGQKETPVKESKDQLTKEEAILYARGLSEEEVEKVKSIASIEGETPLVAAESDYFKIWKEKEDKKREVQETQLDASKGSSRVKPKKDFSTPGMSPEEHKALWQQSKGR